MEEKNKSFFSNITTRVRSRLDQKNKKQFVPVEVEEDTLRSLLEEGHLRYKEKKDKSKSQMAEEANGSEPKSNELIDINEEEIQDKDRSKFERRSPSKSYDASEEEESENESMNDERLGEHDSNVLKISRQLQSTHIGDDDWDVLGENNHANE